MRFMDDESITGAKEFAVGNYLVQMVSDLRKHSMLHCGSVVFVKGQVLFQLYIGSKKKKLKSILDQRNSSI